MVFTKTGDLLGGFYTASTQSSQMGNTNTITLNYNFIS